MSQFYNYMNSLSAAYDQGAHDPQAEDWDGDGTADNEEYDENGDPLPEDEELPYEDEESYADDEYDEDPSAYDDDEDYDDAGYY